ncbi:hypothetical protein BU14_0022s0104 [Porphyra umbilicalis]|uniref:phosphoribosylanthranilate isomerase n=1 Tax=Porphyra umbilicalis TaxID=2786 RepID=A0A1X6PKF2_PORUM|nr:hypothetical protein BU14_0022s0104 [Porphyra umbilicalis]|eukprot:OSX81384.1 hypothetical protein BU14_0022s0104 [Porphyra umbilicalis]
MCVGGLPPPARRSPPPPLHAVKICGVTSPADASAAVAAATAALPPGVELLIGMIAHPPSPRHVEAAAAAAIAGVARAGGATPVVVFVRQTAAEMGAYLHAAGVDVAQLHGPAAAAARGGLPPAVRVMRVVHVAADGSYSAPPPAPAEGGGADGDWWTVYDAGSGVCGADGVAKDAGRVAAFLEAVAAARAKRVGRRGDTAPV